MQTAPWLCVFGSAVINFIFFDTAVIKIDFSRIKFDKISCG